MAIRLLSGQRDEAIERVGCRMAEAAQGGRHVEAHQLAGLMREIQAFEPAESPFAGVDPAGHLAVVLAGSMTRPAQLYRLAGGRVVERVEVADADRADTIIEQWRNSAPAILSADATALPVVLRWLAQQRPRCRIVSLGPGLSSTS